MLLQYHHGGTNGYEKITSPTLLGQLLSKSERTIRRELKRGMITHLDSELRQIIVYNAEYAQNNADSRNSAKGPTIKLGRDWALVDKISTLIKKDSYSPYAVLQHFEKNGWPSDTRICEKTLYNYIETGDIPEVTVKDLLYAGNRRKPKTKPKRHSRAMNAARSIDKRSPVADGRGEVGHWEMDTVYSGKEGSPTCLLTLTERKTRVEVIRKIRDRTAESVTFDYISHSGNRTPYYDELTPNYDQLFAASFENRSIPGFLVLDLLKEEDEGEYSAANQRYGFYTGADFLILVSRARLPEGAARSVFNSTSNRRRSWTP